jgi:hypothetical protein
MDLQLLERQLAGKSYPEIERALQNLKSAELLDLLDSRSVRIGDSAAELLVTRRQIDPVIDRLLASAIRTKLGRMRATTVLRRFGKSASRAVEAYRHLLDDRCIDVVSGALFGLVFWQDSNNLPMIETAKAKTEPGSPRRALFNKAITALRKEDPFLYSSGFCDGADVWKLDKTRFAHEIGFP